MKIKIKDFDAIVKIINEERQLHGHTGWSEQQLIVEQLEENVQDGVLVSTLKLTLQYSANKKNYNNKAFIRHHHTVIELCDNAEKQPLRIIRAVSKDPEDDCN